MNNKYILIFLVTLLALINIYAPLKENNIALVNKIVAMQRALEKDHYYLAHSQKILQDINQTKQIITAYQKKFFYTLSGAQVFNTMQKELKRLIKNQNVHEDLITWGESYTDDKMFEIYPMQVRVSGSIKHIGSFFNALLHHSKIRIKEFDMTRRPEHYILKLSVMGIKRVKK